MLASALTTAVLPSGGWSDLGHNFIFQAGFWGWLIAQCLKVSLALKKYTKSPLPGSSDRHARQVFTKRYKQGVWDIKAMVDSGGMPSSHSSLTAVGHVLKITNNPSVPVGMAFDKLPHLQAVTTAVALEFGLGSSLFAVALCFTVITMYDATGVRRHAGL